jgi:hypothetical protein
METSFGDDYRINVDHISYFYLEKKSNLVYVHFCNGDILLFEGDDGKYFLWTYEQLDIGGGLTDDQESLEDANK